MAVASRYIAGDYTSFGYSYQAFSSEMRALSTRNQLAYIEPNKPRREEERQHWPSSYRQKPQAFDIDAIIVSGADYRLQMSSSIMSRRRHLLSLSLSASSIREARNAQYNEAALISLNMN